MFALSKYIRPAALRVMRMRHHKPLRLTGNERRILQRWARRPKTAQRLAQRARIVPACAEGPTNPEIRRGAFETVEALEETITESLAHHNQHGKPFAWTTISDAILDKVKQFC